MAKPDDTRIAQATANSNNTSSIISNITSGSTPELQRVLEALLETLHSRQASAKTAPKPPKSARRPRIKPRRRVTVSASLSPETIVEIPIIRMCGHWLAHAGFGLGKRVQVHVAQGFMVLIALDAA